MLQRCIMLNIDLKLHTRTHTHMHTLSGTHRPVGTHVATHPCICTHPQTTTHTRGGSSLTSLWRQHRVVTVCIYFQPLASASTASVYRSLLSLSSSLPHFITPSFLFFSPSYYPPFLLYCHRGKALSIPPVGPTRPVHRAPFQPSGPRQRGPPPLRAS